MLRVVIGDNDAGTGDVSDHQAGYNGIWRLLHAQSDRTAFVPFYAGYNLEHIFNGQTTKEPDTFFEPRRAPMSLRVVDDRTVELVQPPTPITGVASVTRFRLRGEDQIDFEFTAKPTRNVWPDGYLGFFWASYINAPEDKSIYFRGGLAEARGTPMWMQLCTTEHGRDSSVCHRDHRRELPFDHKIARCLFQSVGPQVWEEPLFYGRFDGMTLVTVFESDHRLRWAQSPSGGGTNGPLATSNPAWDFQWIIDSPEVGREYRLRATITCRAGMTREEILRLASHP